MSNIWLFYALGAALFGGLIPIFSKIGLKNLDTNTATAVRALVMAVFLIGVVVFQGKTNQLPIIFANHRALLFIVLSGIAGAISWLFYFLALKFGTVYQVAPLDRLSLVFAIVFAVILLGEKLNWTSGLGAIIMVIGAVLISLGK
ncbi:MAG: EamA family transporter [Patescibacteria group bacterium]|jgi:transporter family protein|nr:EamA family transporter [Patescibacteria group bacterium]